MSELLTSSLPHVILIMMSIDELNAGKIKDHQWPPHTSHAGQTFLCAPRLMWVQYIRNGVKVAFLLITMTQAVTPRK